MCEMDRAVSTNKILILSLRWEFVLYLYLVYGKVDVSKLIENDEISMDIQVSGEMKAKYLIWT